MARKYARGSRAWGQCERSGKKTLLKNLVYDGHQPGLLVAREWWEPRHPQEYLPAIEDPVALEDPAPDRDRVPVVVKLPRLDSELQPQPDLTLKLELGSVTVTVS
jgi:hypothetical protein